MNEPISSTKAVAAASALTLVPGADPAIMIGAFTGAVLFIISNENLGTAKRIALFLVSFLGGVICADWVSKLLSVLLPDSLPINQGMGALIASACVVRLVQYLMRFADNPADLWTLIKGMRSK